MGEALQEKQKTTAHVFFDGAFRKPQAARDLLLRQAVDPAQLEDVAHLAGHNHT